MNTVFDYVLVGAGSAGCALAAKLVKAGMRVALLEAGPTDWYPWIHLPVGYFRTMGNHRTDWLFKTQPDPGLANRSIAWPRGKVLGGSSSINGLLWVRGQPKDFEHWGSGWQWEDVLPVFKSLQKWKGLMSEYRSDKGYINVQPSRVDSPVVNAWLEAAVQAGYSRNPDYNGPTQQGVSLFQITINDGFRSSATQFIKPLYSDPKLTVLTDTHVKQLVVEGGRVVKLKAEHLGKAVQFKAEREIVLCAGAISTPQLLMLSGIGPAGAIRAAGITPVHQLAGVGQHLQDHLQARPVYYCLPPTLNTQVVNIGQLCKTIYSFVANRRGPFTIAASLGTGFLATGLDGDRPDIQFHIQPFSSDNIEQGPHPFSGMTASVLQLRPQSKGTVTLNPNAPYQAPIIDPKYLSTEHDRRTLVEGIKVSRRIMGQPALSRIVGGEHGDLSRIRQDDEQGLMAWARRNSTTIYHPTSTCRMGSDSDSVVDGQLRVHGLKGLRIADASVMPSIVSANTNAASMMIGAKLGNMLVKDL